MRDLGHVHADLADAYRELAGVERRRNELFARIVELEVERERLGKAEARLQKTAQGGKKPSMVAAERLRVSKGRGGTEPEALQAAVNAAGYTLRSLATQLRAEGWRVSHPFLRQCRHGISAIRKPLAERIEALTGFRATKANWPKGWAREPQE